jgi:O-antigen ligase
MNQSSRFLQLLPPMQAFCLFAFAAFVCFSIAGAHISLGLLSLCVILQVLKNNRAHGTTNGSPALRFADLRLGFEWPLAVFGLAVLISSMLSHDPIDSISHLMNLTTIIGAYAVAGTLHRRPDWRKPALWIFLSTATIVSVWGLIKYALGLTVKVQSTQSTTMTWGAMSAMFLLLAISTAFNAAQTRGRWFARGFCVPQFFALLLSFVRGAYLGLAAGLAYLLRRQWKTLLPAALVLIFIAGILAPASVRERFASIFDLQHPSIMVRLSQWQIGAQIIAHHPFFGVGWHDLAPFTRKYAQPDPRLPKGVNDDIFHIGHYHNTYITLAVCSGLIGLGAFLWLMVGVWKQLGRSAAQNAQTECRALVWACRAAMLSFLINGMFDWTFGDAEVITMFWFIVGLGLGQANLVSTAGETPAFFRNAAVPLKES